MFILRFLLFYLLLDSVFIKGRILKRETRKIRQKLSVGTCKNPNYFVRQNLMLKARLLRKRQGLNFRPFLFKQRSYPGQSLLEPLTKSEPLPAFNNAPVKVAVANNFNQLVLDRNRDAIIALYAPWCPYCQELLPKFDELGEKLKDENIDVIKMDATSNEVPAHYDVPGYPTIYWAQRDSKLYPMKYTGPRTTEDLLKFVAEHSSQELTGYKRNGEPKYKYF